MDVLCLVIWILNLVFAVIQTINNEPVSRVASICAMLVCVLVYLERILV